jgi:hypothetical protein
MERKMKTIQLEQNYKNKSNPSKSVAMLWSSSLNSLRRASRTVTLNDALHVVRQLIHFGRWRVIPIYLIRRLRPPKVRPGENDSSLLGAIQPDALADEIRRNSVSVVGVLPADFVERIRRTTDKLPPNEYQLVHEVDDDIRALVEDVGVKRVLQTYLKCEPVLLEASLFVTKPGLGRRLHDQNYFHFDYAGWESLNLLVYLTDVNNLSDCHIVARGSHRDVCARDIIRRRLSIEEGEKRFESALQTIVGPAGTVFFENTEAFHRRQQGNARRVMLNLLYASHRSYLSYGRASHKAIEMRNRIFSESRTQGV